MKTWMRRRGAGRERPGGALDVLARGSAPGRQSPAAGRASRSCRTASASASEAIGNPASMMSTPSASSWRASWSFSSMRIENPGACSPSRRVVSKMVSRLPDIGFLLSTFVAVRLPQVQFIVIWFKISDLLMQLPDLAAFLAVAAERSFSAAARRLHRTQPAVSQAVRRLEDELGERLFDRSSRDGTLTEAGRLLQDYAQRLLGMAGEAETAVRELQQMRRGRVIIGANEAAVHSLLPHIERFAVAASAGGCRGPPRPVAAGRRRGPGPQHRLRRRHVPAGRSRDPDRAARQRRHRPADVAEASARVEASRDDRGSRPADRHRAQRSISDARSRASRLRAQAHVDQHPDLAAEPRRNQARGRDGDRGWRCCRAAAR